MTTLTTKDVWLDPESTLGCFRFGEFTGWGCKQDAKPTRWCNRHNESLPAEAAHWCVHVVGVDRAWRAVLLPLAKGRTYKQAVILACSQFSSPSDIRPVNGYFGGTIDLR